jgi:hypothetical protein
MALYTSPKVANVHQESDIAVVLIVPGLFSGDRFMYAHRERVDIGHN